MTEESIAVAMMVGPSLGMLAFYSLWQWWRQINGTL